MADPLLDCAACGASLDCQDEDPPLPSGPICVNCTPAIECRDTDPIDYYSLEGPTFRFVINCPPGYDCSHSTEVHIICCERELVAVFPPGATPTQRLAIVNDLVSRCNLALEFCGGPPPEDPAVFYYNRAINNSVICPSFGTSSSGTYTYTVPAGTFIAETQAEADALAVKLAETIKLIDRFCISLTDLCFYRGVTATRSFPISGGATPFVLGFLGGHGPSGLATMISGRNLVTLGTPNTPGLYALAVRVTDGAKGRWDGSIVSHVLAIQYNTTITAGFTVPAISSPVTVPFTSVAHLTAGDTVTIGAVVGGVTAGEAGVYTVSSIASLNVTLTLVSGTPGTIFLTGTTAYWSPPSTLPDTTTGVAYSFQLPASGGNGIYTFTLISGFLPGGITLSPSGLLSGVSDGVPGTSIVVALGDSICPLAGVNTFTFGAAFRVTIPPINWFIGDRYTVHSYSIIGGVAPFSVAKISGNLPAGIFPDISGSNVTINPTSTSDENMFPPGMYEAVIEVTDSLFATCTSDVKIDCIDLGYSSAITGPITIPDFNPDIFTIDFSFTVGFLSNVDKIITILENPVTLELVSFGNPPGVVQTVGPSYDANGAVYLYNADKNNPSPGDVVLCNAYGSVGSVISGSWYAYWGGPVQDSSTGITRFPAKGRSSLWATPEIVPGPVAFQIPAIGGDGGAFTFAVVAGSLPTGLSLSSTGLISGTYTGGGTRAAQIAIHDATQVSRDPSYVGGLFVMYMYSFIESAMATPNWILSGNVFSDTTSNGVFEYPKVGIAGVVLRVIWSLDGDPPVVPPGLADITTDAGGSYRFLINIPITPTLIHIDVITPPSGGTLTTPLAPVLTNITTGVGGEDSLNNQIGYHL